MVGLELDLYASYLYVIDKDAVYYRPKSDGWSSSSCAEEPSEDKQTYDSSVSSTYASLDYDFTAYNYYNGGRVAKDTLVVGSLQAKVTFERATKVKFYMHWTTYDGTFGLATANDGEDEEETSLLNQLAPELDSPVFTVFLRLDNEVNGTGQFALGGLAPDTC